MAHYVLTYVCQLAASLGKGNQAFRGEGRKGNNSSRGGGRKGNHASRGGGRKGNHASRGGGRDEIRLILMLTWMTHKLGKQSNHNSQSQKRIYYKRPLRTQI